MSEDTLNKDNVVDADESTDESAEVKTEETVEMSHQDENWELVTFLNFSWFDADKVGEDDREYLLRKAEEIKLEVLRRRKAEMEEMERRKQEQQQQMQQQQMQQQMMQQQQQQPQQMPSMPQQQDYQQQQGPPQWGQPPQ